MTNDEAEFLLFDRITKIQSVMRQHGEDKFALSFSGGKDSTVLHYLLDEALPGNRIPRLFADTGIEFRAIVDFVNNLKEKDDRIVILKPRVNIKKMLEAEGYPFKSKKHALNVARFQKRGMQNYVKRYYEGTTVRADMRCPQILKYQFEQELPFKISDVCCDRLKKDPLKDYQKEHNKPYSIIGLRIEERGRRAFTKCMVWRGGKLRFHPLAVTTEEWINWYIEKRGIQLCKLYSPPYNFERTGCKGCPFAVHLQDQLEVMQAFFPKEREQCEIIWKPVYEEYRRLGYRLKKEEQLKIMDI